MSVSVIIPTYNRAATIERAVRSVLAQTYQVDEVIIVDDGGTDDTCRIVENIGDSRIVYIKNESNLGAGCARNVGMAASHGDYIAFQDSDDEWLPDKLEKQMKLFEEKPGLMLVYCSLLYPEFDCRIPEKFEFPYYDGAMRDILLMHNTAGTPSIVISRQLYDRVGGFDENLYALEDWEFVLRASGETEFGYVPEPLVNCYRVDSSISRSNAAHLLAQCEIIGKYRDEYLRVGELQNAVANLLERAEENGVADRIARLLTLMLSK